MTRKRIVSYILAVIMLVSTCAVPVSTASAADISTEAQIAEFDTKAEKHQATWEEKGRNNKTTIFIGDSYFDALWNYDVFYNQMYAGKDVLRLGVASSATNDWERFMDKGLFLVNTMPENIVVHLGHNDIHDDGDNAETVTENLQHLFNRIHKEPNLKNAKIYFFGITYKRDVMYAEGSKHQGRKDIVDKVNTNMKTWCEAEGQRQWMTYIQPVHTVTGFNGAIGPTDKDAEYKQYYQTNEEFWYQDYTHLSHKGYQAMQALLAETNIVIRNKAAGASLSNLTFSAAELKEEWNVYGNPRKTTLFIGDSVFSRKYWDDFDDTYAGKDVMLAGIDRASTLEWQTIFTQYFTDAKPKNLVVHLGTEDIHKNGATGAQTAGYLKTLFTSIHGTTNYADTHIYYFGIPECKDKGRTYDVSASNAAMKTWCEADAQKDWITYIAPIEIADNQFLDEINLTEDGYQLIVDKLETIIGTPKVAIDFNTGTMENSVAGSNVEIGKYKITGAVPNQTLSAWDINHPISYTSDRNGDAGSALVTDHRNGPYTAIDNYAFGTNDFVISAWFNLEDISVLSNAPGNYLFGVAHPDDTQGFSVCIKENAGYKLRLRSGNKTQEYKPTSFDFKDNTWYHITVCREDNALKWYLNGTWIYTYTISAGASYDTKLVFGAYPYTGTYNDFIYKDSKVYFDDIKVYDNTLTDAQVAAICEDRNIEDARQETRVVGDANFDDVFNAADLIRLQRYVVTKRVDDCSFDGDTNVSGKFDGNADASGSSDDIERCMEMLIGDNVLHVTAKAELRQYQDKQWVTDEKTSYKLFQSTDNFYMYYELKKNVKAGQEITFDLLFGNGNYSAYAYYDGCGRWEPLGTTSASGKTLQCSVVPAEDIKSLRIKVVNDGGTGLINTYNGAAFKVNNIQVSKEVKDVNRVELSMTYGNSKNVPVLYGMSDTLDMTKFKVQASTDGLSYEWTLMKDGVEKTVDRQSKAYAFDEPGTYILTATATSEGISYKTSMNIHVFGPDVYVNYNDGKVENSGLDSSKTIGLYKATPSDVNGKFTEFTGNVSYTTDRAGNENGAINTASRNGSYTVVENSGFGSDDFVVSTWFNVPQAPSDGKGEGYILGTVDPNYGDYYISGTTWAGERTRQGFYALYKLNSNGSVQLCMESDVTHATTASESRWYNFTDFEYGQWYHLTASRVGNVLSWYLDGALIKQYTLPDNTDYGTNPLAVGGYEGWEISYMNGNMYFDDIEVYGPDLTSQQVKNICQYAKPEVYVDFSGAVENTGSNKDVTAQPYKFKNPSVPTEMEYVPQNDVTYIKGISGEDAGALSTKHYDGVYTVVENYNFGKNNFTVSAWINIPSSANVSGTINTYLFGTTYPKGDDGFALFLRKISDNTYDIRRNVLNNTMEDSDDFEFTFNTWHNVVAERDGNTFKVYFDGTLMGSNDLSEDADFGNKPLAFGAYVRDAEKVTVETYSTNTIYYDQIEVYDSALTETQIQEARIDTLSKFIEPDISLSFTNGTMENNGIYRDILLGRYKFNNASWTDYFKPADKEEYVNGVFDSDSDSDSDKAVSINHHDGAYIAAHDYDFGTNDFTFSTWFMIPEGEDVTIGGNYLFGTTNADSTDGFSVLLKYDKYNPEFQTEREYVYSLRLHLLGTTYFYVFDPDVGNVDFKHGEWYHLTLCREGSSMKLYLGGKMILEDTMAKNADLGIENLNIGAAPGRNELGYQSSLVYFDEVQLYSRAMTNANVEAIKEGLYSNNLTQ